MKKTLLLKITDLRLVCLLLSIIISLIGCKKFVVADPPPLYISSSAAFSTNSSAIATATSMYISLKDNIQGLTAGPQSIGSLTAMESDEIKNYNSQILYQQFYTNSINKDNSAVYAIWQEIYSQIHTANLVIENLEKSTVISSGVKQQLSGEAKFMRAFLHFYAVNLFGKVPLVITSDYRVNNMASRSEIADVYKQIIIDIKDAQNSLSNEIVDGYGVAVSTRYRPNKWTATALLARVYLYLREWSNAEAEAEKFRSNNTYALDDNLNNIFIGASKEIIWQMQAVRQVFSAVEGLSYILLSPPGTDYAGGAISSQLLTSFEPGDARFSNWVGKFSAEGIDYYYPFKYKVAALIDPDYAEHTTVFRLAEQYLITAEAKIQQDRIPEGIADLNILRKRSRLDTTLAVPDPLPDLPTNLSKEDALKAVMHERQTELFTEWGHRWFDLKRTGALDTIMEQVSPTKNNAVWNPDKAVWPIPQAEILLNSNLKQNASY
jgi:starch-binding outer membrane protein, SusD/RagB family